MRRTPFLPRRVKAFPPTTRPKRVKERNKGAPGPRIGIEMNSHNFPVSAARVLCLCVDETPTRIGV